MAINRELVKMARRAVTTPRQKKAFQPPGGDPSQGMPPGGDPSQGGMPPMDPSMAGGMPPGAPMDPSMMAGGGMPPGAPMDPGMMSGPPPGPAPSPDAGAVPGAGGMNADTIRQVMQEVLGQLGMVPGQAGPGGGAAGGKPGKPDLLAMSMDIFQLKKMVSSILNAMDIPLPQDIIDGPNRDPATGAPMAPGTPGSTSDPSRASPPSGGDAGSGGPSSAIKPIGPMQGAFPGGGGGGGSEKTSMQRIGEQAPRGTVKRDGGNVRNKAAALSAVLRSKLSKADHAST